MSPLRKLPDFVSSVNKAQLLALLLKSADASFLPAKQLRHEEHHKASSQGDPSQELLNFDSQLL